MSQAGLKEPHKPATPPAAVPLLWPGQPLLPLTQCQVQQRGSTWSLACLSKGRGALGWASPRERSSFILWCSIAWRCLKTRMPQIQQGRTLSKATEWWQQREKQGKPGFACFVGRNKYLLEKKATGERWHLCCVTERPPASALIQWHLLQRVSALQVRVNVSGQPVQAESHHSQMCH